MKQILYVSPFSYIGGGEMSLLATLKSLDRGRFNPHLICYASGPFVDRARSLGFKVSIFKRGPFYADPFLIIRLTRYIKKNGIDIVDVNSLDIRAGVAAWFSRVPLVGRLRVIMPLTWRDRLFVQMAERVIAVSRAVVDSFCETFPACEKAFVIIPNSVELPAIIRKAPLREELGLSTDACLVGAVGRIDPWKGYEYFIDAAVGISRELKNSYFFIAGEPSETDRSEHAYLEDLKAHVVRSGLVGRFFFIGFRDDPLSVIAACDVIVIPSYPLVKSGGKITEGFGRVAAEAMAVGVPVVASNVGGLSEIVENGNTGFLVSPQDSEELCKAVLKVMGDRGLRALLARNARAKFESLYTIDRQRLALKSVYENILSAPEKRSPSIDYVMQYKNILYSLIAEKIRGIEDSNILDIGCNVGADLRHIYGKYKNLKGFGMDMNFAAINDAHKTPGTFFVQAAAQNIPFRKNAFGAIILSEVIEHLGDVDAFLREVRRVLKKDGYLFITTPPRHAYTTLVGKVVPRKFKKLLRRLVYPDAGEMSGIRKIMPDGTIIKEHVREYDPPELKRILERNGFFVETTRQGFLRVPVSPLFDRFGILLKLWKAFDAVISKLPFSIIFKANYIIVARNSGGRLQG